MTLDPFHCALALFATIAVIGLFAWAEREL